jgi:ATP-binding cassette subfamily C (CFTR/MRP) protein 1
MWMLPAEDSAESLSNRLQKTWDRQRDLVKRGKKSRASLKIAIAQAYGGPYILAGIFKGLYDALSFLQPQLLKLLLAYVSSYGTDHPMPAIAGYAISILMFLSANLATSFLHQYFDRCFATSKSPAMSTLTSSDASQGWSRHFDLPKITRHEQRRKSRSSFG